MFIRLATGLSVTYLEEIGEVIVPPLTTLYNESLKEGNVSSAWKQSSITPVHQRGCIGDPSNYWPIPGVPVVDKMFEFYSYLEIHLKIKNFQLE